MEQWMIWRNAETSRTGRGKRERERAARQGNGHKVKLAGSKTVEVWTEFKFSDWCGPELLEFWVCIRQAISPLSVFVLGLFVTPQLSYIYPPHLPLLLLLLLLLHFFLLLFLFFFFFSLTLCSTKFFSKTSKSFNI